MQNKLRRLVKEQFQDAREAAMSLQADNAESSYLKHMITIREGYIKKYETCFTTQLLRKIFTCRKMTYFSYQYHRYIMEHLNP